MAAVLAPPRRFVPEKLHRLVTDKAGNAEDGIRLPIAAILSRAFHFLVSKYSPQRAQRAQRKPRVNVKSKIKRANQKIVTF
jgi:hypothetical protein